MSSKLFVGGLAWATTDASLRAAFAQFGEVVDAKVITDRESGRSRGFGFVTYGEAEHAQQAMQQMDGAELDGRSIRVNEAQERRGGPPPRSFGRPEGRREGGGGGGYPPSEPRSFGGGGAGEPQPTDGKSAGRKRHNGGGQRKAQDPFGKRRGGGKPRRDDHRDEW